MIIKKIIIEFVRAWVWMVRMAHSGDYDGLVALVAQAKSRWAWLRLPKPIELREIRFQDDIRTKPLDPEWMRQQIQKMESDIAVTVKPEDPKIFIKKVKDKYGLYVVTDIKRTKSRRRTKCHSTPSATPRTGRPSARASASGRATAARTAGPKITRRIP
jgi:hypothetical protein